MLSFAFNHAVAGEFSAFQLKLTNTLIHCAIAILIFVFACQVFLSPAMGRRFGKNATQLALLASMLWLFNPLHVSSVLYVVQRMAQLSTLFVMLGLVVYVARRKVWAERGAAPDELIATALWLLLIGALAVLSKENGILLFWLIPVVEVTCFRGRWAGLENSLVKQLGRLALLTPAVLLVLIAVTQYDWLAAGFERRNFSLEERLLTQARVLWHYVYWILVPNNFAMAFQHDDIAISRSLFQPLTTFVSVLIWLALGAVLLAYRKRWPLLVFGTVFFLIAHIMESSFVPLEMVYEHRNYLPSIGLLIAVAGLVGQGLREHYSLKVMQIVCAVWLGLMAAMLSLRVNDWSDEVQLARTDVVRHPASARSHYFYGNALLRQHRHRESLGLSDGQATESLLLARHHFERMHQNNPSDIAALALLYYLDTRYFTALDTSGRWYERLLEQVQTSALQASDWNALDMLANCMGAGSCPTSPAKAMLLFDTIQRRFPESAKQVGYRYRFLEQTGAGPEQRVAALEALLKEHPSTLGYYQELILGYAELGDVQGMYSAVMRWVEHDRLRLYSSTIKSMFRDDANAAK